MLKSIQGSQSIHRIGQISCHRDQLDGMTPSFQEWALTTRDGDGLKQENTMDSTKSLESASLADNLLIENILAFHTFVLVFVLVKKLV